MTIISAADFGATLARARKGLGLTQRELALAVGVGERFIVELEAGKPTAQLGKALAAARAAGMMLADTAEVVVASSTPRTPGGSTTVLVRAPARASARFVKVSTL